MIHRLAVVTILALCASACASKPHHPAPVDQPEPSYLFVQTCTAGKLDGDTLTLQNVGPTLYFTDRPYRVEGHVQTGWLIKQWDQGEDSFASNPPNAVLSVFDEVEAKTATLILTEPRLVGSELMYTVTASEGSVPATFGEASLFIDSFHGGRGHAGHPSHHRAERRHVHHAHRRYGRRRGVIYGGDQEFTDLGETGPPLPHLGL